MADLLPCAALSRWHVPAGGSVAGIRPFGTLAKLRYSCLAMIPGVCCRIILCGLFDGLFFVMTLSSNALEARVISFVAEETGSRLHDLNPRTTLFGDIGIDGDDGVELLAAFMQHFEVDMALCDVGRHFGREGIVPWASLHWVLLAWRAATDKGSTPESRACLVPIAVQDLIDSARAKKWAVSYDKTA